MNLEQVAENLARALGHDADCKLILCDRCCCDCGTADKQAKALDEYEYWRREHQNRQ